MLHFPAKALWALGTLAPCASCLMAAKVVWVCLPGRRPQHRMQLKTGCYARW